MNYGNIDPEMCWFNESENVTLNNQRFSQNWHSILGGLGVRILSLFAAHPVSQALCNCVMLAICIRIKEYRNHLCGRYKLSLEQRPLKWFLHSDMRNWITWKRHLRRNVLLVRLLRRDCGSQNSHHAQTQKWATLCFSLSYSHLYHSNFLRRHTDCRYLYIHLKQQNEV